MENSSQETEFDYIASIEWRFKQDTSLSKLPIKKVYHTNVLAVDFSKGEPTEDEVVYHFFGEYMISTGLTIDELKEQIEWKFRVRQDEYRPKSHLVA